MKRRKLDDLTDSFFKPREWIQEKVDAELVLGRASSKDLTLIVNRDKSRMRSIKQKVRRLLSMFQP